MGSLQNINNLKELDGYEEDHKPIIGKIGGRSYKKADKGEKCTYNQILNKLKELSMNVQDATNEGEPVLDKEGIPVVDSWVKQRDGKGEKVKKTAEIFVPDSQIKK